MKQLSIAVLYLVFAGIATCANIAAQWLSAKLLPTAHILYGSMLVGTAVGLAVKYALDKRWIFSYQVKDKVHGIRTFLLYSIMGVLTTMVFWGSELLFQRLFGSEAMRYVGAVIGLSIGYVSKYNLDKRFVFVQTKLS